MSYSTGSSKGKVLIFRFPKNAYQTIVSLALCFQLTACGTILYPERRGQTTGRLDAGVVLLDGIGLLVFLIPGIIAFAVDFSTGAIYLPNSARHDGGTNNLRTVYFDPDSYTQKQLEDMIRDGTGGRFSFYDDRLERIPLNGPDEVSAVLARLGPPSGASRLP